MKQHEQSSTKNKFSIVDFNDKYGSEEQQRKFFFDIKWPNGYVCPECGNTHYTYLEKRKVYQCTICCKQSTLLAGTVFQDCKLSFYKLLLGIYFFVSSESGISGTKISELLGINCNTGRLLLRKLRSIAENSNADQMLSGIIHLDCSYFGGVGDDTKAGLGTNKQTTVIAVSLDKGIYPRRIKLGIVSSENEKEIASFALINIKPNSYIKTDGGRGMKALGKERKDCEGKVIYDENGIPLKKYPYTVDSDKFDKNSDTLKWNHIFSTNIKSLIAGIYHGINTRYLDLILSEIEWRINHRNVKSAEKKMFSLTKRAFTVDPITNKMFISRYALNLL